MADAPASVLDKYYATRAQNIELGKAFDSEIVKEQVCQRFITEKRFDPRHPDLEVLRRQPVELIPEDQDRARAIRMDDSQYRRELASKNADNQRIATEARALEIAAPIVAAREAVRDAEIAELKAQIAALMGATPDLPVATNSPAPAETMPRPPAEHRAGPAELREVLDDEPPNANWRKDDILTWAFEHGIHVTEELKKTNVSKALLVEHILDTQARALAGIAN